MGERSRHVAASVEARLLSCKLLAQCVQPLGDRLRIGEVGGESARDRLVLDAGERCRGGDPVAYGLAALPGEAVVRARACPARLPLGRQLAELLEPLRLRIPLALRRGPVDAPLAHHAREVVRARAALSDEDEHDVRERC